LPQVVLRWLVCNDSDFAALYLIYNISHFRFAKDFCMIWADGDRHKRLAREWRKGPSRALDIGGLAPQDILRLAFKQSDFRPLSISIVDEQIHDLESKDAARTESGRAAFTGRQGR
jgi:hypothetical protein